MPDPTIQRTIDHLLRCHRTCRHQIHADPDPGAAHVDRRHTAMLTDVSELSRHTADLLDRDSPWAAWLCELTRDACIDLAEQCEQYGERACADICRATALACALIAPSTLPQNS
ncbi:hypothetical protein [Nocardia otitidiscaviarum]|uniref:hypothetical protein n=1 Tax=Nocardia otitidiscaviarum TaxID=1823 RepID=UPI001894E143|nr:hypothetical protein [Nocardia otitidiscaviarum]MBF6176956.1 hypothetical protein [Nocardia otitidiscaviarum]